MQAILILSYTDKTNLIKLIKSFNDEMNVYVHINSASNEIAVEDLTSLNYENLTVIKKYNTTWGAYGFTLAALELMKMAISNEKNNFIHIISGQDYKIKTNRYFERHFEDNDNIYLSLVIGELPYLIKERYQKGMFSSYFSPRNEKFIKINHIYQKLYNKNNIGEFKDIYKGAIWNSIPRYACKYILEYIENNPQFMEDLKQCIIPDEFFIHTIIMNSIYKSNVVPRNLRYIDWNTRNGNNPAILDETDFVKFKNSDCIFVRKVVTGISDELVNLIDEHLLKEKLIDKTDLINTFSTKEFENLPKDTFNIINKYDDEISCYELFDIFGEITECASVYLGDTNNLIEELLSYFDLILEKYDLYNFFSESHEIYNVPNCELYEDCTMVSSDWIKSHNDLTVTFDDTGLLIENNTGSLRSLVFNKKNDDGQKFDWVYPLVFEFTVVSIGSARVIFQLKPTGTAVQWFSDDIDVTNGDVIRIELTKNQGLLKKNGIIQGNPQAYDNTACRFTFLVNDGGSLKINDLKIFPI